MRIFFTVLSFLMLISTVASAQYTISERADVKSKVDTIGVNLPSAFNLNIRTKAYYDYVKRKRRLERNFFNTVNNIKITQYAYDNWEGGGENYFHGNVSTRNQYVYIVDKFTVDTYLNAAYGLRQSEKEFIKAEDNFEINSDISYVLYKRWSYTFGVNLKSQFTKSYPDIDDKSDYSSNFFAPANLKPYFGFTFKVAEDKKITFAPLSGNILMVFDKDLVEDFDIEKGKRAKLSVGSYINCQWTEDIIKDDVLKYRGIVQSFCDYKTAPNVSWENWLDFKIFKFFTLNLYVKFIYDDKIEIFEKGIDSDGKEIDVPTGSHFQIKETLGFGITYSFKNKSKPKYKIIK